MREAQIRSEWCAERGLHPVYCKIMADNNDELKYVYKKILLKKYSVRCVIKTHKNPISIEIKG